MSEKKSEKRRLQRLPLDLEAICQSNGAFFRGYVQDISTGGLKLETQKKLEKGTNISMSIDSPRPLKLEGMVRWAARQKLHFLYGIKFHDMTEEKEAQLRELVQGLFWKSYGG